MKDLVMFNALNTDSFDQSFDNLSLLSEERKEAFINLKKIGIPSKRDERWKYTDLKNDIRDINFSLCETNIEIKNADFDKLEVNEIDYFINNKDLYFRPVKCLNDEGLIYLNLSYSNLFKIITIRETSDIPVIIDIESFGEGMSFPRILINVLPGVKADIQIFNRGGLGFINQLIELNIEKNSSIHFYRFNESSSIHSETFLSYLGYLSL